MRILHFRTSIAIVVIFVFNCYGAYSQSTDINQNHQINKTFTSIKLSDFELKGFENRAIQKVQDFGDYFAIVSTKDYDLQLRKHSIQMLENLFVSKLVEIDKPEKQLLNLSKTNLKKYLQTALENQYSKIEITILKPNFEQHLKLDSDGKYKGLISFTQANKYFKDKKLLNTSTTNKQVQVLLLKTIKTFGNKKENVWNVYLGDISSN